MIKYLVLSFNSRIFIPIAQSIESLGYDVLEFILEYNNDALGNTKKIQEVIEDYKPDIVFSYGWWDNNIDIDQYEQVIKASNCVHTYWNQDDPVFLDLLSLPMARFSHIIFTTDEDCIEQYDLHGIKAVFLPLACSPCIHTKVQPRQEFKHDIVLLANNYNTKSYIPFPNRINGIDHILKPLLNGKYDIKVYGLWWLEGDRLFTLPKRYFGGCVKPSEVAQVYSSSKIALGFLSVGTSKTMLSMRLFEALGSGIFYLTQYSPALETFFNNHEHLVWSNSPEETLSYVNFYLKNDFLREKIAKSGQELVYRHHTYLHRAYQVIRAIEKGINN